MRKGRLFELPGSLAVVTVLAVVLWTGVGFTQMDAPTTHTMRFSEARR